LAVLIDDVVDERTDSYGNSFDANAIAGHTHTAHPFICQNPLLNLQLHELSGKYQTVGPFWKQRLLFQCVAVFQFCGM
jgi:hypothetical protein